MSATLTAHVQVEAVSITCPRCEWELPAKNGSLMFTMQELDTEETEATLECPECSTQLRLPATARLRPVRRKVSP